MTRSLLIKLISSAQLIAYASIASIANADVLLYQAITDFPVIDAGEVPYYKDSAPRNALAVDASMEEYREKFARAEVVFDGQAGLFDMTIIGLAELDGAATYNLLVNSEIVGTATNPAVVTDYTPIRHTFEDINVPDGAILAVESLANSNDTVPEGNGYAFARGRWTALELTPADTTTTPDNYIDLDLTMISDKQTLSEGEEITLTLTVSNSTNSIVATVPLARVTLPGSGLTFVSGTNCFVTSLLVECQLPELAGGDEAQATITLMATRTDPSVRLNALARAQQIDSYEVNDTAFLDITIIPGPDIAEPGPATEPDLTNSMLAEQGVGTDSDPMVSGSLSMLWILLLPVWLRRYTDT